MQRVSCTAAGRSLLGLGVLQSRLRRRLDLIEHALPLALSLLERLVGLGERRPQLLGEGLLEQGLPPERFKRRADRLSTQDVELCQHGQFAGLSGRESD